MEAKRPLELVSIELYFEVGQGQGGGSSLGSIGLLLHVLLFL